MDSLLERLAYACADDEMMAGFVNEFGLDISGDESLLQDSIKAAEQLLAGCTGSVNSLNQLLSDGIYISFDKYEHDTEARWFLRQYIAISRDFLEK